MKNLAVSTTFLSNGQRLQEALDLCKDSEISSIELGSNHCYEQSYNYVSGYDFHILVHNYFPIPKESFVVNIASLNEDIRKKSIEHIKKAINFCCDFDGLLYTFHPGFLTDPTGSSLSTKNHDFQWEDEKLKNINYSKALEIFYSSLDEILKYSLLKKIPVAIETEGSISKKDHLIMQQPEEYQKLMVNYSSSDLGVNLNIGHLNLAAKAFNFNHQAFVNLIEEYIVALELSHNDGKEDQHLPLHEDDWYWEIITDPRFEAAHKILEYRNTSISDIKSNIEMIENKFHGI